MRVRELAGPVMVLMTCLVAACSYIGAVRQGALVGMVLPLTLVSGLVAVRMHDRRRVGLITVAVVAFGGGEVINVLSGQFQGSVARSAGASALATGVAVLLSTGRRPAMFLLPVVGIVTWALALGAGARVQLVAVATAAVAVVALALVERQARTFATPPPLARSVLLALVLTVVAAVGVARYQFTHNARPAASPFRESLATTVEPPAFLSLTRHPPKSATEPAPATTETTSANGSSGSAARRRVALRLLLGLAGAVALGLLALAARLLWVALAWRRRRRRLQKHVLPPEAGAWMWITETMERLSSPLPANLSPDLAAERADLGRVQGFAARITPAVFAGRSQEAGLVWPEAREVRNEVWSSARRAHRVRALWRTPRRTAGHH